MEERPNTTYLPGNEPARTSLRSVRAAENHPQGQGALLGTNSTTLSPAGSRLLHFARDDTAGAGP